VLKRRLRIQDESGGVRRWWEFYFVRYAMGTVIGGVLFYVLCRASPTFRSGDDPVLVQFLQLPEDPSQLTTPHLLLLLAYGLTYCYIASAPILVFHAARFGLVKHVNCWTFGSILSAAIVAGGATWIGASLGMLASPVTFFILAFAPLVLWIAQIFAVSWALTSERVVYESYQTLDKERGKRTSTFRDSYRHLREHGNSFFIVLCELIFACALSLAGTGSLQVRPLVTPLGYAVALLIIIGLWVIPSTLVWWVATRIELNLVKHAPGGKSQIDR
jgi:hypothetical protein